MACGCDFRPLSTPGRQQDLRRSREHRSHRTIDHLLEFFGGIGSQGSARPRKFDPALGSLEDAARELPKVVILKNFCDLETCAGSDDVVVVVLVTLVDEDRDSIQPVTGCRNETTLVQPTRYFENVHSMPASSLPPTILQSATLYKTTKETPR